MFRVLPDAGERDDVDDNSATEKREVKCRKEEEDVPGLAGELTNGPQGVVTHPAAGVILQRNLTAEDHGGHSQDETPHPGDQDEDCCPFTGNKGILMQWSQHCDAPLNCQQEDSGDGDKGASSKDRADDVAWVKTH